MGGSVGRTETPRIGDSAVSLSIELPFRNYAINEAHEFSLG